MNKVIVVVLNMSYSDLKGKVFVITGAASGTSSPTEPPHSDSR